MIHIDVRIAGGRGWWRSTISKNDPLPEFAELFDRATAEPPEFGEIGAYVEPPTPEAPGVTPLVLPPAPTIPPEVVLPPAPVDWDAEATRFISAIFTVRGQNVRSSMNVWAVAVALTPEADRDSFADTCATMVPALNDWEGLVFAERDRLKALPNSVLTDANWPVLPVGAPQFIEWCAEP
jgi:hypothetical protein